MIKAQSNFTSLRIKRMKRRALIKKVYPYVLFMAALLIIIFIFNHRTIVRPISQVKAQVVYAQEPIAIATSSATPTPTFTEKEQIAAYIQEVFGKDADKAFRLLQCENRNLQADAISPTNDHGVFQVNAYWQKVQPKFLKNWKINVQIAKQLFDENGGKFNLWTCGRKLGI